MQRVRDKRHATGCQLPEQVIDFTLSSGSPEPPAPTPQPDFSRTRGRSTLIC